LANLDQNNTFFQGTFNDASVGFVNGIPTDTGTLNAYSVTVPLGAPSAYQAGMYVVFIPLTTNTGSATLTVAPLGSQLILDEFGNALGADAIIANRKTIVIHDGTNFCLVNNALAGPPIGSITMFGGATAPFGWLLCNGAGVSTTTYANLFAVIGYNFGGSGATFNLPNLFNVFPRGGISIATTGTTNSTIHITAIPSTTGMLVGMQIAGAGIPASATIATVVSSTAIDLSLPATASASGVALTVTGIPGATGGSTTISIANLPAHSHPITDVQHAHSYAQVGGAGGVQSGAGFGSVGATTSSNFTGITTTNNTGSGSPYLPPYVAVGFIIKT
jgi:microcystin-dependent protein